MTRRVLPLLAATMFVTVSAHAQTHAAHHALNPFPFKGKAGMGMGPSSKENPSPPNQKESTPSPPNPPLEGEGYKVDHSAMNHDMQSTAEVVDASLPPDAPPITPIPLITASDRLAAFPDVDGHTLHDNAIHSFWLLDRLETWDMQEGSAVGWDAASWIGTDLNRIWLRSEGENLDGSTKSADLELLYGRAVTPWWDVVTGVRHDFGVGPSQTFAAIGVQGLAPYKFEVAATAYLGQAGQTAARFEVEYETLFTNRAILQWQLKADIYGKGDPQRGIGAGLSSLEVGLRLRYEFTRQLAPYIGIVHERAYGESADLRQSAGEEADETRFVVGLRTWF